MTDIRVWDIVVVSERTAQASVLRVTRTGPRHTIAVITRTALPHAEGPLRAVVKSDTALGFLPTPVVPADIEDPRIAVAALRGDRIQTITLRDGEVESISEARYTGQHLRGVDWGRDQAAAVPSLAPQTAVFRVPGGTVEVLGDLGRAVKTYTHPEEVAG